MNIITLFISNVKFAVAQLRAVARSEKAGFQGAAAPWRGVGCPHFLPSSGWVGGEKRTLQQPCSPAQGCCVLRGFFCNTIMILFPFHHPKDRIVYIRNKETSDRRLLAVCSNNWSRRERRAAFPLHACRWGPSRRNFDEPEHVPWGAHRHGVDASEYGRGKESPAINSGSASDERSGLPVPACCAGRPDLGVGDAGHQTLVRRQMFPP